MKKLGMILGVLLISNIASAASVSLVNKFEDREVRTDDGTHTISLQYEGQMPTVTVEEDLATCQLSTSLNGSKVIIKVDMETERDDGFNGCLVSIKQPSGKKATVSLGYFIGG